jgi:hypothetical protein
MVSDNEPDSFQIAWNQPPGSIPAMAVGRDVQKIVEIVPQVFAP